jgi:hypothetical protein
MNPVFIAVTRREYILVGSAPASLLETVTSINTEFISQYGGEAAVGLEPGFPAVDYSEF